jgi:hypothetical protein
MKLFEVDLGSASDVLRILQSNANQPGSAGTGKSLTVPFSAMINLLDQFDLGISTIDGIRKWVETVPGAKAVIDSVLDDGSVIVKTTAKNPNKDKAQSTSGPSPAIDAMASKNAKTLTR